MATGSGATRGGKNGKCGTPQCVVASPLANIYMNRFLKHWRLTGRDEAFRAHIVNYADDFVILSQRSATEALAWTKAVMTKLGLTLNGAKTSLKDARTERFDFLGYSVLKAHTERSSSWTDQSCVSCVRDEGWPLGIGFQEPVPNHSRLLR
jgi:RNA-directed DNA polymerase